MKMLRRLTKQKLTFIIFLTIALSFCISFFSNNFFEKNAYDLMVRLSANKSGLNEIVYVVIDDESIKKIGSWPWARVRYAEIFEYLENYSKAKAIGFDAVLTTTENSVDDAKFIASLAFVKNLSGGIDFSKNINDKNDEQDLSLFQNKFAINVVDKRTPSFVKKTAYNSFREPMNGYLEKLNRAASVNTAFDKDGVVRGFEPVVYMQGKYYPSLPLAIFMSVNDVEKVVLNNNNYEVILKSGKNKKFALKKEGNKSVQYLKWLAPCGENSLVPHREFSAADVIKSYENIKKGTAPVISPEEFKDKIVIVGATANALYDLKVTPLSVNFPGNAIQGTALDNLMNGKSFFIAPFALNFFVTVFLIAIVGLLVFYFVPIVSFVSILLVGFLYFYALLFSYAQGLALNVVTPLIFLVLAAVVAYAFKFSIEDIKKEKLKRAMKKYINTNLVEDIIENSEEEVKLGGKKSEVTILMADIRGFTRISEKLEPDAVTALLNEYFGIMIPIIESYGGTVNKFIGDAILAVFNEPIKDKKHAQNAIRCATKMLAETNALKKKWMIENKPKIGISIGINTGTAFIGNIGTPNHLEYTVIGDTVNVASRIEAQNRQFNTQILISESTYELAKDILDVIKISSVEIRGREKHIDIYEIINIVDKNEAD